MFLVRKINFSASDNEPLLMRTSEADGLALPVWVDVFCVPVCKGAVVADFVIRRLCLSLHRVLLCSVCGVLRVSPLRCAPVTLSACRRMGLRC